MLTADFFNKEAEVLAQALLGKVLCAKYQNTWLTAMIIETEAYYLLDKASHSSLGFTPKRRALFMPGGTIYMYHARGKDSLNISAQGDGNAVLIKSAIPYEDSKTNPKMISIMQRLNPYPNSPTHRVRAKEKLCSGQTLLCQSLGLKVKQWDQKAFDPEKFYVEDVGYRPEKMIKTTRLGIPLHRDPHLLYRFIDYQYANHCTSNPLTKKSWQLNKDYFYILGGK